MQQQEFYVNLENGKLIFSEKSNEGTVKDFTLNALTTEGWKLIQITNFQDRKTREVANIAIFRKD